MSKKISLEGADDVYLTDKSIAVRRIRSGKSGRIISIKRPTIRGRGRT